MLVHLTGARYQYQDVDNIALLRRIAQTVKENGHRLVDDWVEEAATKGRLANGAYPDIDWATIHPESVERVSKADVIIADSTVRSFYVGYQVALAAQMKKPILILYEGAEGRIFYRDKVYHEGNLEEIVTNFLKENTITPKDMRFNFFINRQIYNYLRWASFKTGKTKAEVLRELIEREIEDKEY